MSDRLGLIAGGGALPLEIARAAGDRAVLALGYPGITDPRLEDEVEAFVWESPGALDAQLRALRDAGTDEVVLAGKLEKIDLLRAPDRLGLDDRARGLLAGLADRRDARLLAVVADLLEEEGFAVLPQAALVPHLVPRPGRQGRVAPDAALARDLAHAWPRARALAEAGVGQCLVAGGGAVIAVEGIDGTDATIRRAGALRAGRLAVVKRAGRGHDPRFDWPAIGPRTVDELARAGGGALAIEAGASLLIDRAETVARADAAGIAIVAAADDGTGLDA